MPRSVRKPADPNSIEAKLKTLQSSARKVDLLRRRAKTMTERALKLRDEANALEENFRREMRELMQAQR